MPGQAYDNDQAVVIGYNNCCVMSRHRPANDNRFLALAMMVIMPLDLITVQAYLARRFPPRHLCYDGKCAPMVAGLMDDTGYMLMLLCCQCHWQCQAASQGQ